MLAALPASASAVVARFTFSPSDPAKGDTVTFDASNSEPTAGATIAKYEWDLNGDGSFETDSGTDPTTSRTYASARTYGVRLRVTDSGNLRDSVRHSVTVTGQPPNASFTFSPASPGVGQPVLFSSTSTDPDGTIVDQAWDLNGDGNFDNGSGPSALRSFSAPGSYVVGLRVTDDDGKVAFLSQTVSVNGPAGLGATSTPGRPQLRLLSPFPLVRIAGQILRRGTRVRLLTVEAPAGAKVSIRCSGRGCPFRKQVRVAQAGPNARAARRVRVRRLERLLRPGVRVRIFVTRLDAIGKYTRFRIRRGKAPARADRCIRPGSWRPVVCPAA